MAKDYIEITKELSGAMREMRKDMPDVMQSFSALAGAASKDGVLSKKVKEFVALGIGIATRCDGCIGFHTKALIELGATKEEFEEVLGLAIYMGGGPSVMYAANAMIAWEQFSAGRDGK